MTTRSVPTASASPQGRAVATPAQNLVTILVSWWLMIGIFIDGWAHNTQGEALETFFTPWHAVFYSGCGVAGGRAAVVGTPCRSGTAWRCWACPSSLWAVSVT